MSGPNQSVKKEVFSKTPVISKVRSKQLFGKIPVITTTL